MLMNAANSLNISTPNMYPVSRPINMIDSRVMIFVSLVGNSHSFQSCSNVPATKNTIMFSVWAMQNAWGANQGMALSTKQMINKTILDDLVLNSGITTNIHHNAHMNHRKYPAEG